VELETMLCDVGLGGHALLDEIEAVENVLAVLVLISSAYHTSAESVF
jgi:hypothetical protein